MLRGSAQYIAKVPQVHLSNWESLPICTCTHFLVLVVKQSCLCALIALHVHAVLAAYLKLTWIGNCSLCGCNWARR